MRSTSSLVSDLRSSNVVLVDDDAELVLSLSRALKASGFEGKIHGVSKASAALELRQQILPEVMIVDLCLDERVGVESGLSLLREIVAQDPSVRVVVLTGHGGVEQGVQCLRLGAANFIEKPADVQHLLAIVRDGVVQCALRRELSRGSSSDTALSSSIVGNSPESRKIVEAVRYAASSNQSIIVTGETGTGKGLCAQAIHFASPRAARSFVRYQPTFGAPDLVNSDLFGHVKGAFTGANESRRGLISEADGGTLFLDEIDELPVETQVALLGVLQERRFRPLGSNREERADFRLITATNRPIEQSLAEGRIRMDFFHRIAHYTISLPPLRERIGDVAPIAMHVLGQLRSRERVSVFDISEQAMGVLRSYQWPGNVRELEAVVERAAYSAQFAGRTAIAAADVGIQEQGASIAAAGSFHGQVEEFKHKLILAALAKCGGNQVKASEELRLDRSSMRRILARRSQS